MNCRHTINGFIETVESIYVKYKYSYTNKPVGFSVFSNFIHLRDNSPCFFNDYGGIIGFHRKELDSDKYKLYVTVVIKGTSPVELTIGYNKTELDIEYNSIEDILIDFMEFSSLYGSKYYTSRYELIYSISNILSYRGN